MQEKGKHPVAKMVGDARKKEPYVLLCPPVHPTSTHSIQNLNRTNKYFFFLKLGKWLPINTSKSHLHSAGAD